MKIWDTKLVSLLDTILPTYAEGQEEPETIPCITYRLTGDNVDVEGDDLRYSNVYYILKLYDTNLETAEGYLQQIDTLMYLNRFFRESLHTMDINNIHQYIITYRVHTRERLK